MFRNVIDENPDSVRLGEQVEENVAQPLKSLFPNPKFNVADLEASPSNFSGNVMFNNISEQKVNVDNKNRTMNRYH